MATATPLRTKPKSAKAEMDDLVQNVFDLTETQLAKLAPDQRKAAIASIHATAESLRAGK